MRSNEICAGAGDRSSCEKLPIQVRRAIGADQLKVLEWLMKKFPI